jgi:hypothetical protein
MIIYAVLKKNCYLCTSVNKYLNYLDTKSDMITYINYYPSIEYILINYRESHKDLVLRFPKIFLFHDKKSYDITSKIVNDAIKFNELLDQVDYKNLTVNKFVNNFIPLKNN